MAYESKKTSSAAREFCKLKGATLALIDNKSDNDVVYSLVRDKTVWIGVKKEGRVWKQDDGSKLVYSNWDKTQPDNAGGKQNMGSCGKVENGMVGQTILNINLFAQCHMKENPLLV